MIEQRGLTEADREKIEALIRVATARHRIAMNEHLAELQPIEAMAVLGDLMNSTLDRFPSPPTRRVTFKAWVAAFLEDGAMDND